MRFSMLLICGLSAALSACGDGIRSGDQGAASNSSNNGFASDSTASATNNLELLAHRDNGNNSVDVLMRAYDASGNSHATLSDRSFSIYEDDQSITGETSYWVDHGQWLKYAQNVQIAVDVSSSMNNLGNVRQALSDVMLSKTALDQRQSLSILSFDHSLMTHISNSNHLGNVGAAISNVYSRGVSSTDLYGTLASIAGKAYDRLSIENLYFDTAIVITDGDDTAGRYTLSEVMPQLDAQRIIVVNTGADSKTLRLLAGGGYFDGRSNLQSAIKSALAAATTYANSHYLLHYVSAKRSLNQGGAMHSLSARVSGIGKVDVSFRSNDSDPPTRALQISPVTLASANTQLELRLRVVPSGNLNEGRLNWAVNTDSGVQQACTVRGQGAVVNVSLLTVGRCSITAGFLAKGDLYPLHATEVIRVN